MPGRPAEMLPPLAPGALRGAMEAELELCTAQIRPEQVAAVAARGGPTVKPEATPTPLPPVADGDADKPEPSDGGFDIWAWLGDIRLPGWLTGLPWWALIALAPLVLALLGWLFRRRDGRADLLGPPPHMRPGGRPVPPAPWRSRFPPPR